MHFLVGDEGAVDALRQAGARTLTICGAMSHMCIDATTRAAFDYGFKCTVAENACASAMLSKLALLVSSGR